MAWRADNPGSVCRVPALHFHVPRTVQTFWEFMNLGAEGWVTLRGPDSEGPRKTLNFDPALPPTLLPRCPLPPSVLRKDNITSQMDATYRAETSCPSLAVFQGSHFPWFRLRV